MGCFSGLRVVPGWGAVVACLKVPSAYLLTDIFLRLDAQLEKKVFRPSRQKSRTSLAANEGVKAKRLIGSLRALWRSSPEKGQDSKITELKSYLQASPKPRLQPELGAISEPEADPLPEAADHHGDDRSDSEPEAANESEDDKGESQGSVDEDSGSEGPTGGNEDDGGKLDGSPLSPSQQDVEETQATPSSVRAPTLRLGFHAEASPAAVSDSSSASDGGSPAASSHQDSVENVDAKNESLPAAFPVNAFEAGESQVPNAGWMGHAIANFNSKEFSRKYLETRDFHYNQLMSLVKDSIAFQLGDETVDGCLWHTYDNWCRDAFIEFGDIVFEDAIKGEFFRVWARMLKSQA